MSRRGKIARLPRAVREELNQRIEDGEAGARLVAWLNGQEEVQGVLEDYFGGRPINEQNLSDWRAGGYADWQQRQETFELANGMMDEAAERDGLVTVGRLSDYVGDMAALSLARMLQAMRRMEDGPEQWATTLKVVREVVRLRQSDRAYEAERRTQETFAQYPKPDELETEEAFEDEEMDLMDEMDEVDDMEREEDEGQETGDGEQGTGDGGQETGGGQATEDGERTTEDRRQRTEDRCTDGAGASPAAQPAEAGTPAEADKPGAAPETTAAPQAPAVPQASSRLIKVGQRSRRGGRWVGPWRVER